MNENNGIRCSNKTLSMEEKRNYCIAWKKSGMSQLAFCKMNGISKSALYNWNKECKKENRGMDFSPIALQEKLDKDETGMIQLNIECPNQIRLSISIPEYRLITFIQEIGYATSTLW